MMVDTNIVIALLDTEADPGNAIGAAMADLQSDNNFVVNEIIFAEVSGRFANAVVAEARLRSLGFAIERLSLEHCHRASVAFRTYRRAGGVRTTILPDFLIGAHAAGKGWPIATHDRKGFESYFPEVELIDPLKATND